jgi:hypothetical protein
MSVRLQLPGSKQGMRCVKGRVWLYFELQYRHRDPSSSAAHESKAVWESALAAMHVVCCVPGLVLCMHCLTHCSLLGTQELWDRQSY